MRSNVRDAYIEIYSALKDIRLKKVESPEDVELCELVVDNLLDAMAKNDKALFELEQAEDKLLLALRKALEAFTEPKKDIAR
jgi:hypothetical protein